MILGAPGTGARTLRSQLRVAMAHHPDLQLAEDTLPGRQHSFALLMGLDLPVRAQPERAEQSRIDAQLRHQLQELGVAFRVVYGTGPDRLTHALLALDLPVSDRAVRESREASQFKLNRGRTAWSCETCSDPDCEHRLFTGLLGTTAR